MGRNMLPIWKEFDVVNDKKYPDVECRHCAFFIPSAQPSRGMIRHLKICEKLTSDDRNAWILRDEKERKLKNKLKGQVHIGSKRKHQPDTSTDDEDSDPSSRSSSASTADSHTNENWTPSEGEVDEYHMLIAKFFYVNGLAFRLIDDQLAKAVLTAFCPKMPLPTRQQLAGPLLDRVYDEVRQETIKTLMKQGNVALVSDGWSNARREQVINFVLTAPKMSPILWSTQTTGEASKTGEYIADMVSEEIKDIENVIGTGKVCGLTTDNAANMVKAWKLLEKSRPNFYCGGCGSHTLNLLLKNVLAIQYLKKILSDASTITRFIRTHDKPIARFISSQKAHPDRCQTKLVTSVATRWYSHGDCIRSVMKNKATIEEIMNDAKLLEGINAALVAKVKAIVKRKSFWTQGNFTMQLLDPITKTMAKFEKDSCSLSAIYEGFIFMKGQEIYTQRVSGIPVRVQEAVLALIKYRWCFIHTDAMGIAYMLDHRKDTSAFQGDDKLQTLAQLEGIARRILPPEKIPALLEEVSTFMTEKLNWKPEHQSSLLAMSPVDFWTWGLDEKKYSLLPPIARRVFTVPTSSAASERSWSIHKFIHSDSRNRLKNETVRKLATKYSNYEGRRKATASNGDVAFDGAVDVLFNDSDEEVHNVEMDEAIALIIASAAAPVPAPGGGSLDEDEVSSEEQPIVDQCFEYEGSNNDSQ